MLPSTTQFKTERLIIRPYRLSDAVRYYELGAKNREHLARYETNNPIRHLTSVDDAVTLLASFGESWNAGESYFLGIFLKDSGALIGQVYVGAVRPTLPGYAIGYIIDADHQGRGYISEAVKCVAEWLFTDLHAHRLHIECDDTNTRSAAVARRCGFRQEAHFRSNKRNADGAFSGTLVFGLLNGDR